MQAILRKFDEEGRVHERHDVFETHVDPKQMTDDQLLNFAFAMVKAARESQAHGLVSNFFKLEFVPETPMPVNA